MSQERQRVKGSAWPSQPKANWLWYVLQPELHSSVFSLELTGLLSSEWLQSAGSRSRCLGPDPESASCGLTLSELNLSVPQFLKMELHYNPPCRTLKRLNGVLYIKHSDNLCHRVFNNCQPFLQFVTWLLLLLIFRIFTFLRRALLSYSHSCLHSLSFSFLCSLNITVVKALCNSSPFPGGHFYYLVYLHCPHANSQIMFLSKPSL